MAEAPDLGGAKAMAPPTVRPRPSLAVCPTPANLTQHMRYRLTHLGCGVMVPDAGGARAWGGVVLAIHGIAHLG